VKEFLKRRFVREYSSVWVNDTPEVSANEKEEPSYMIKTKIQVLNFKNHELSASLSFPVTSSMHTRLLLMPTASILPSL
jgi:hypothetical protein